MSKALRENGVDLKDLASLLNFVVQKDRENAQRVIEVSLEEQRN